MDPDNGDAAVYDGTALTGNGWSTSDAGVTYMKTGTYGTATLTTATGVVGYALNNADPDTDALAGGANVSDNFTVFVKDGSTGTASTAVNFAITGTNDAANDLTFTYTGVSGNSLPNGVFGNMSVADPDGGAQPYSFAATGLTATTLSGGAASNFAGDLTVSSSGVISASNLDDDRVYDLTVQVTQGTNTFSETFSVITGTNASDTVDGAPAVGDDVIFARGQGDVVLAGSGNDTVFGQADADQIHGGLGNDTLYGGGGDDMFYFDSALNATTNVDTIMDFNANNADQIRLENAIFTSLAIPGTLNAANFEANAGGNATTSSEYILYDTGTGNLYYDADGNGIGAKELFANITVTGGTFNNADFLII